MEQDLPTLELHFVRHRLKVIHEQPRAIRRPLPRSAVPIKQTPLPAAADAVVDVVATVVGGINQGALDSGELAIVKADRTSGQAADCDRLTLLLGCGVGRVEGVLAVDQRSVYEFQLDAFVLGRG